jgi:hypothetical protein
MTEITIEQARYGNPGSGGFRFLGRSPGFLDDWLPLAEQLCNGFGERPGDIACPGCVFARPLGPRHVAVIQAADLGRDDANRPGAIGFRLLVLIRQAYEELTGDPFHIAEQYPPFWQEEGELPTLKWTAGPVPPRTVREVEKVLQSTDSATLLGGVQALIDAGRLVFERREPDTRLLRRLWTLLPTSTRCNLWPASYAFGNALGFDVLVVPRADPAQYESYLREEQAGDYPEGRYELNLQIAAESGDQAALDALFARRSSKETLRLAVIILAVVAVIAVLMNWGNPPSRSTLPGPGKTSPNAPADPGNPPLAGPFPPLTAETQSQLAQDLHRLVARLGAGPIDAKAGVDQLLLVLHGRLGKSDLAGSTGRAEVVDRLHREGKLDHPEKHLRTLLWQYQVPGHDDLRLNVVELVERLEKHLVETPRRVLKTDAKS